MIRHLKVTYQDAFFFGVARRAVVGDGFFRDAHVPTLRVASLLPRMRLGFFFVLRSAALGPQFTVYSTAVLGLRRPLSILSGPPQGVLHCGLRVFQAGPVWNNSSYSTAWNHHSPCTVESPQFVNAVPARISLKDRTQQHA